MATQAKYGHAAELQASERFCACCGAPLTGRLMWLERNHQTNQWLPVGSVPEEQSQGLFPFGVGCARTVLRFVRPRPIRSDDLPDLKFLSAYSDSWVA
jgi:hypothetical protein